jgi:lysophospholipase L1-like esterase
MATVTNTIKLPDGTTPATARVEIELVASESGQTGAAAWIDATDVTVLSISRPTVTAGVWSVSLTPNADIDPANTAYRVNEYVGRDRYVHYIEVGSGGGNLHDLLTEAPASVASSALQAHLDDGTGAHAASAISYAGSTSLAAANVEAALDELDAEKAPLATGVPSGGVANQVLAKSSSSNYAMAWRTPTLLGPTFVVIGDQESERYESWPWLVTTRSEGRLTMTQHADLSVAGLTAASALTSFMQWQVPTKPAFSLIAVGMNDLQTITVAQYVANMKALIAAVEANGSVPVLVTPYPQAFSTTTNAVQSKIAAAGMWVKNYAALAGLPMVDLWGLLVNPATGFPQSQYLYNGDYYNQTANVAMADRVIEALSPYLRPWKGIEATFEGDVYNLIPNAFTLPDSNADGIPNGWSTAVDGTGTTISLVSDSRFKGGRAIQIAAVNPTTARQIIGPNVNASGTAVSAGDTLAFTCSYSVESSSGLSLQPEVQGLACYATTPAQLTLFSVASMAGPGGGLNRFTGLTYFPVDTSLEPTWWTRSDVNMKFRYEGMANSGKSLTMRIGDLGIYNLTKMGVVEPTLGYAAGSWNWFNVYASTHNYWLAGT